MDKNPCRVTVKRIEKIPSRYYVQVKTPVAKARTKVKVEVSDSLLAESKRLTDALRALPPVSADFSGTLCAQIKAALARMKSTTFGCLSAIRCMLAENTKRMLFSGAASCTVAAMAALILAATCSFGCVITVNGQVIGTVPDAAAYDKLVEEINEEIAYVSGESFTPAETPDFSTKLIPKGAYTDEADVKEQLKATDEDMLPAYGIYVNDEILLALPNEQAALTVLEDYKNSFTEGKDEVTAEFCEPVTVAHRFVPKCALKTAESAMEALKTGRIALYTPSEGETLASVAENYGITTEDILQQNADADLKNPAGVQLKIRTGQPLVSVKTVEHANITESIPFNTIEKEDPTKYEGNLVVEQEGVEGSRVVEAYITAVNGVETGREVVSENLLSAAVDQIVQKGTKEPPSPIGTGSFSVPTSGSLSSRFGSRWGRSHTGVDLAAATGTNIYAADNGTVIYSAYNDGGYGNLIQIDHGNGLVTYYGHCSELLVPVGTVVAKGDLIAKVGNTGRSYGSHLHFEVRSGGTPQDPMAYLNGLQ